MGMYACRSTTNSNKPVGCACDFACGTKIMIMSVNDKRACVYISIYIYILHVCQYSTDTCPKRIHGSGFKVSGFGLRV